MNYEMMTDFINYNDIVELDIIRLDKKLSLNEAACAKITSLKFFREHCIDLKLFKSLQILTSTVNTYNFSDYIAYLASQFSQ